MEKKETINYRKLAVFLVLSFLLIYTVNLYIAHGEETPSGQGSGGGNTGGNTGGGSSTGSGSSGDWGIFNFIMNPIDAALKTVGVLSDVLTLILKVIYILINALAGFLGGLILWLLAKGIYMILVHFASYNNEILAALSQGTWKNNPTCWGSAIAIMILAILKLFFPQTGIQNWSFGWTIVGAEAIVILFVYLTRHKRRKMNEQLAYAAMQDEANRINLAMDELDYIGRTRGWSPEELKIAKRRAGGAR